MEQQTLTTKLALDKDYTLDEIKQKILNGYRFKTYQYCLSPFALAQRRFSPAYLVTDALPNQYTGVRIMYNILSLIFGWWSIPYGPIRTIESIILNNRGGLDVTEDILLNITDDSLKKKQVELQKEFVRFAKPGKWDMKDFDKSWKKDFELDFGVKEMVVGLCLNPEEDVAPYYIVGFRLDSHYNMETFLDKLMESFLKRFPKTTYYEYLDLNEGGELGEVLRKQGETLICRDL